MHSNNWVALVHLNCGHEDGGAVLLMWPLLLSGSRLGSAQFHPYATISLSLPQDDGPILTAMSTPAASSVQAVQSFSSTFGFARGLFHSRCLPVAPCGDRLYFPLMASLPRMVLPGYIFGGKSMSGRAVFHMCVGKEMTVSTSNSDRVGEVKRVTNETNVNVKINLDGSGSADNQTGIPFLDHMLDQLASHGLFDVTVKATGDIHIDDHHTNEDVALAIGSALHQSLGDRKGINRFGDFSAPLDEALVHVSMDLSGRPHLSFDLQIPSERVGTYDTQLVEHFFQSLVNTSGMTLHIRQLAGKNSHHIIEAAFKAFARALRQAIEYDLRRRGTIPSSKGILSRS